MSFAHPTHFSHMSHPTCSQISPLILVSSRVFLCVQLYRIATVVGVEERGQPYALGSRRTTKHLLLDFGECKEHYPMSVVSNGGFEELELRSWQQILEASSQRFVSRRHVEVKENDLQQASSGTRSHTHPTPHVPPRPHLEPAPTPPTPTRRAATCTRTRTCAG